MTWQSKKEDSERGDEIPVCKCLKDPNIQKEGSYLGPQAILAQNQTDVHGPWGVECWNSETFSLSEGGRFCNLLMLLGMSTSDTVTSWQNGRGKGGNERRGWMIQDVLLHICVLSSVFILIW